MAATTTSRLFFSFIFSLTILISTVHSHNITDILSKFPDYSIYNSYLTQTKLADEINTRETLTCLVLNNAAMSSLAAKRSLSAIKNALSLLTVLDYFDGQKLHDLSSGTVLSTTLYQTTGNAPGNLGFVNITDLKGGKVGFGSAAPGSTLDSTYVKSVKQIPYNISVVEISAPIVFPGLLTDSAGPNLNLTAVLDKAGCKIFASLVVRSGVLKSYQSAMSKGLTILAPSDMAFAAKGVPDVGKLSSADLVALLQYHALPGYVPKGALKTTTAPIGTMASSGAGKYDLSVSATGDEVTLHTGVDSSRVSGTVVDSTPICILTVDNVLLPRELFGTSPSPAPALGPVVSPAPSPLSASPSPSPVAKSPSPAALSPPAPPAGSPDGSPSSDSPSESANVVTKSGAGGVRVSKAFGGLAVLLSLMSSLL
ncbi:Fasciclin-like arabinogalactan protein 10 [Acorus calamus]|uniref:Fasciclin-like arabinogalactan protein 10 n=1 Tax=Acorus calamus TaxID=4465 RepID=A0AAV9DWD8_ACOCL|nr:Fasciclin-like arabinogalactan protein 10 [Acorus calamus]